MKAELIKLAWALTVALISVIAVAQVPSTEGHSGSPSAIASVPFFVDDSHGNPAGGVTEANLSILDNKKESQSIVAIQAAKSLPLRLGLLIDTSRSEQQSGQYRPVVEAMRDFLNLVLTDLGDKAFIVTFDSIPYATNFANRDEVLAYKIDFTPRGGTALYDSIYLACVERMNSDQTQPVRRVLVILSDGDDNQSRATREKAIAVAQATRTVIFAISTGQVASRKGDANLQSLADQTGGRAFFPFGRKAIVHAFLSTKGQMDNMYSVMYVPAESGNGRFHLVELKSISDTKLKIRAPKGYYVSIPR